MSEVGAEVQMRAVEGDHLAHVGRIDEEERSAMLDVLAEHLRRLMPVRGAAGGVQERHVIAVADLLRRAAGTIGETFRQDGSAQCVLERLSCPEVGRKRNRPDEVGGADARDASWWPVHGSNLRS